MDTDPYQNVMDPQHCVTQNRVYLFTENKSRSSTIWTRNSVGLLLLPCYVCISLERGRGRLNNAASSSPRLEHIRPALGLPSGELAPPRPLSIS